MDTGRSTRSGGEIISVLGWILVGGAAWLVVAVVLAVGIGRMVRMRDRQVPRDDGQVPDASAPRRTRPRERR